jgi:hypothetical protein
VDEVGVVLELVRVEEAADHDAWLQTLALARERDAEATQAIGAELRRFLAGTRFAAVEAAIVRSLAERRRVRFEVFSNAAELHAVPWELLTLGDGRHLGELEGVEIVYRWPGTRAAADERARDREGGRIVVAWSRACGNVGEEFVVEAVETATRSRPELFRRAGDVVEHASLPAIAAALEAGAREGRPPTLLVLLCHGAPTGRGYGLGLDDGRGGRDIVDGAGLRRALAAGAGHLRAVLLLACDGGNPGELGARIGSVAQELHRAGIAAVIAPRYPITGAAAVALTGHVLSDMVDRTWPIDRAFQAARERLVRSGSADFAAFQCYAHAAGVRPLTVRPYRGLLAFEREHAGFYFGRDAELAETLGDLDALFAGGKPRLLVVAGASGTGKSSLVLAPVRVALEARGWHVAVIRPGDAPDRALAAAPAGPPGAVSVLVVDQFEEVFTHGLDRGRADAAAAFVRVLWDMSSRSDKKTAVIVTLRVDYVGRCGELAVDADGARLDRVVYDEAHRVFVAQMGPEGLRAAIERPAARAGLRVESGLADRLLREVSGESNALALLSYVLDELWRRRDGEVLTHAALDAAGGVNGALSRHADAVVDALDEPARAQARRILVRLVSFGSDRSSGTRRREEAALLRSRRAPEAWDRAVDALIDARLVVRRSDGPVTLEVAHEAIIRHWDRLWTWYQADRDALARRHELERLLAQYRRDGALAGKALALGQKLIDDLDSDEVDPEAAQMIAVSTARARRQQWVRRGLVTGALVTLSAFVALGWSLYLRAEASAAAARTSAVEARTSAVEARSTAERARSAARLMAAERVLEAKPHLAGALLRGLPHTELSGWRATALAAVHTPLPTIWPGVGEQLTGFAFAGDGTLVAAGASGSLYLFPADGGPARTAAGAPGILVVAFAPAGDVVYVLRARELEAWAVGAGGLTRQAATTLSHGADDLRVGGRTGALLIGFGSRQTVGQRVGDRFELGRDRPRCITHDVPAERSLCRIDDHSAQVEAWTGEVVARVDSPGIGRAFAIDGGLYGGGVWSWPSGQLPGPRLELPESMAGNDYFGVFADGVVTHEASGSDFDPGRLCVLPPGANEPVCEGMSLGCNVVGRADEQPVIACPGSVQFRIVATRGIDRLVRGFEAPAAAAFVGAGHLAVVAPDGALWRWRARDLPSRRARIVAGFGDDEATHFHYRPRLHPGRAGVVALGGVDIQQSQGMELAVWPLRTAELPVVPPPLRSEVVFEANAWWGGHAATRDGVVAMTGDRLIVFTIGDERIEQRIVALGEASGQLLAATPDGAFLMMSTAEGIRRVDVRGEVPRVHAVPGSSPDARVHAVDPAARTIVTGIWAPDGDILDVVDVETGQALARPAELAGKTIVQARFAADGTLALGASDGTLVVARFGPDRALVPVKALEGHRARIVALAFSADGATLVSADGSGNVVVSRNYTERDDVVAVAVAERIADVGLSPDGRQLWVLSPDGDLLYWTLYDDAELAAELTARATYCLTADEWIEFVGVPQAEAEALAQSACPRR